MAADALQTTERVKIIDKREFAAEVPNADNKTFIVHIAALAKQIIIPIYSSCQAQITSLMSEETRISIKYSDFSNIFLSDSVAELPEYNRISDHSINLPDNKQQHYGPIYSLELIELKALKTYIKVNLASGFIKPSKSSASASILFV